jgi:hypothetical protein
MDEIVSGPRNFGMLAVGDLPDFVSPVDGTVVHGRAGLREHDKRHGTTNIADYKETWAKNLEKRAEMSQNGVSDPKRTEQIIRAFNDLNEGRKKR